MNQTLTFTWWELYIWVVGFIVGQRIFTKIQEHYRNRAAIVKQFSYKCIECQVSFETDDYLLFDKLLKFHRERYHDFEQKLSGNPSEGLDT